MMPSTTFLTDPSLTSFPPEPLGLKSEDPARRREAFVRTAPARAALRTEELFKINLDVPGAVGIALSALPRLGTLRSRMGDELSPEFVAQLDQLEELALATAQAHIEHRTTLTAHENLHPMLEEAQDLRELFLMDASALARRGRLPREVVDSFRKGTGYKDVAVGLMGLTQLFRTQWEALQGKAGTTPEELDRADQLASSLLSTAGARAQGELPQQEVGSERQRAFTLFARAYDQVRRAVHFLRWEEDDADTFAPSVYASRARRSSRKSEPPVAAQPA
jgi:hypothetical protein